MEVNADGDERIAASSTIGAAQGVSRPRHPEGEQASTGADWTHCLSLQHAMAAVPQVPAVDKTGGLLLCVPSPFCGGESQRVDLQDSISWAIGFAVPAAAMAVAIVTFLAGSSLYTHVEPTERCTSSLRSSARLSAAVQSISVRVWIWRKSGACLPCQRPTALVPTALPCVPVIPTWSSGRAAAPRFMSGALKTRGI